MTREQIDALVAERDSLRAEVKRLRKALIGTIPASCRSTCTVDMNYGDVKHHDDECAALRRLVGQEVDANGRIPDHARDALERDQT